MAREFKDITGKVFHRLTATGRIAVGGRTRWQCLCTCGNTCTAAITDLQRGKVQSCGCWRKEQASAEKHGGAKRGRHLAAYGTWCSMKQRCLNKKNRDYPSYGGRGITVCKRWLSFENFLKDMGDKPSSEHTIERLNNERGYSPSNCAWVLRSVQNNNRRNTRRVEAFGEIMSLADWSRRTGIKYTTLQMRLRYGWGPERALTSD